MDVPDLYRDVKRNIDFFSYQLQNIKIKHVPLIAVTYIMIFVRFRLLLPTWNDSYATDSGQIELIRINGCDVLARYDDIITLLQEGEMFSGHETAEVRDGVVEDHLASSGRFEFVAGRTAQTAAGCGSHAVNHHCRGRQECAKR